MKFKEHDLIENLPKIGRPALKSNSSIPLLIRDEKRNTKKKAPDLLKEWKSSVLISVNTVKRILRKYQMFGRIAANKPLLNQRNIHKRFQWCKFYTKLDRSFLKDVIFSEESRLEIYSRRREYVCRPQGARYEHKYKTKTVKFEGKTLMDLEAIKEDGSRILIRCPDQMNSDGYQVLKKGFLPTY